MGGQKHYTARTLAEKQLHKIKNRGQISKRKQNLVNVNSHSTSVTSSRLATELEPGGFNICMCHKIFISALTTSVLM